MNADFPHLKIVAAKFDVRFYLVAILFIIFDLEAAFLFPLGCQSQGNWLGRLVGNDDFSR